MAKRSVTIEVRTGEAVAIDGGEVLAVLEQKSGQRARIRFEIPEGMTIERVQNQHNVRAVVGLGERNPQGSSR